MQNTQVQDNIIVAITGKSSSYINFINGVKVFSNVGELTIEFIDRINKDMENIYQNDFTIVINASNIQINKIDNLKISIFDNNYTDNNVLETILTILLKQKVNIEFVELLQYFTIYKYLDNEKTQRYINEYKMFNNRNNYIKKSNNKYKFVNIVNFGLVMFLMCVILSMIYTIFSYKDDEY